MASELPATSPTRNAKFSPKQRKEPRTYPAIIDAYGKSWLVLEERQTQYGLPICLGWPQPGDGIYTIDKGMGGHTVIVTTALRDFVLGNLEGFTGFNLPLSTALKYRLRREISSRRFQHLRDWHTADVPEAITYIDPDLVDGAEIRDVTGQRFRVEQIRRASDGMGLYYGTEVGKRSGGGLIVTPELADLVRGLGSNPKALSKAFGFKEKALRNLREKISPADTRA